MLVDARVLETQDRGAMEWLRSLGHQLIVVVTKMDKLSRAARQSCLNEFSEALSPADSAVVIGYSAVTHEGRDELWRAIRQLVSMPHR